MDALAPQHPPCFRGRSQWVAWLAVAQVSGDREVRALNDEESAFSTAVDFCTDCEPGGWRRHMKATNRCKPNFLKDEKA